MRKLKLFFACLLMAVLSIGQVWATDFTLSSAAEVTKDGITVTFAKGDGNNAPAWYDKGLRLYVKNTVTISSSSATITGISFNWEKQGSKTFNYSCTASVGSYSHPSSAGVGTWTGSANSVTFTLGNVSGAQLQLNTFSVTTSGGTPDPSVSVSPDSWNFGTVHASAEASKVFSVSGSNLTAGDLTLTVPEGFSVSPSSIAVNGTLDATEVTVSKNTSTEDDYAGNLEITGGGLASAKTVSLTMTVDADPAPTGTFELFNGDIEEGDYVIYYSGRAMNNTVTSNRLQYVEVTPSDNKITNPDEAIIWHIAASGDYWTLYNAAVEKYAGGTTTKNQGAVLAEVTDYAKWTITGSSTYDFENLGRANGSSDTGNKWLRNNGTYGFACYTSTQQGTGPLTLYKKQVAGQPKAPTFSVPGGNYENAQSVELSCETEDVTIHYTLDGTNPTDASPVYSTALAISSTTTIKAIAIKNNVSSTVASATYTIVVWQTVDEIWSSITSEGPNNAHVWGYVSQANVGGYNNNYYISVDGSLTANQLEIYKGDNAGNTVAVGDKVHVNGDLTIFNSIKEFKQNTGVIVHYAAKGALQSVAVSETPTKTEYAANETFDPAGLKVYGTYANGFVTEITEGITWGNDLSEGKVTEGTTVHVTATVSGITSLAHDVEVTVLAATLDHISLSYDAVDVYQGKDLPKPVVTAHWSDNTTSDVTALADFAGYDKNTAGNQTITVSYQFGTGDPKEATYTVTVKPIYNTELNVADALDIITTVIGNTKSSDNMVVRGIVSRAHTTYNNTYWISDDGETTSPELEIYAGKYIGGVDFTAETKMKKGDEVVVTGKVIYYNNSTAEFAQNESQVTSLARVPNFTIANIASFEVGADDLEVSDLTIVADGEGAVTLPNDGSDNTDAVTIVEGKLHAVAPGAATITANLAANGIYKAATATFEVTVVAPATKYAISFDGNGADGGNAPEAIADKAAGTDVELPANSYTYTGHNFTGWKVYDENEDEVTIDNGHFEMPASPVTIKAQWAEIPVWAYTYTSNVTLTGAKVKFYGEETEYDAVKAGTGSAAGSTSITVPAQATKLHFHAYGWNTENVGLTVTAPTGVTVSPATEISINKNAGIKENSPFTLAEGSTPMTDAYYVVELSGNDDEIELTFTATSGKRFVLFGVNQEGGQVPELQSLELSGDLENKTYEAGASINPAGLTVMGTYTLGGTPQAPVDVTDQVEDWLYDALQVGDETVTISAKIGTVTSNSVEISGLTVTDPTPRFETNPSSYISFGSKVQGADIAARDLEITLINVNTATVEISGAGAAAFSVDEDVLDGNATIHVSASSANVGTFAATLTISDDEGIAADKEISLSLTITAPVVEETAVSTTSKWVVATAADLVDGAEVLITGVKDDVTYAIGVQNDNNRAAVAGTLEEGVFTPGENTMSFTLVAQEEEGVFALQASNGEYLYAASSAKNYLKRQATLDDNAKWTLTATSAVANGTNTHNDLKFNATNNPKIFSCYTGGQTAIQFYVPKPVTPVDPTPDYTRTVEINRYGTICLPNGGTIEGAKLYDIDYYDGTSTLYLLEVNGNAMVAGRPYIFLPSATSLEVFYTDDEDEDAGTYRGLVGSYSEKTILVNDGNYILYENAYYLVNSAAKVGENRAYIHMESVPTTPYQQQGAPRRRVTMTVYNEQTTTDIDALNASETPVKMIIDGQMYILRGEKMYDATGRLVK